MQEKPVGLKAPFGLSFQMSTGQVHVSGQP